MDKKAGILLHLSSLPSPYGIGSLGQTAYDFVDFLKKSKQIYWQILPIGPTSYKDSPYQTLSVYAGNPYFIDLDLLIGQRLLTNEDLKLTIKDETRVDYGQLYQTRFIILKKAYRRFNQDDLNFLAFQQEHHDWLDDYALFMALKNHFNDLSWIKWPLKYRYRNKKHLTKFAHKHANSILFWKFVQFIYFQQWENLKSYANKMGIHIIGDLPIYVSYDSSDVWANRHLFQLNKLLKPTYVAGVPADSFSKDGQLWGNPLYNWDLMKKNDYQWWINRIKLATSLFDMVRIDHFVGFDHYYKIGYRCKNAKKGFWVDGPGYPLFNAIKQKLGPINIIAEDLGDVTDSVKLLLKKTGFPGMKLVHDCLYHLHKCQLDDINPYTIIYPGTHDNQTSLAIYNSLPKAAKQTVLKMANVNHDDGVEAILKITLNSPCFIAIIPLQDYLKLDDRARMNYPATLNDNWSWRTTSAQLNEALSRYILKLTIEAQRA